MEEKCEGSSEVVDLKQLRKYSKKKKKNSKKKKKKKENIHRVFFFLMFTHLAALSLSCGIQTLSCCM